MNGPIFASIRIVTEGALRAHLSFVEPARGVAQISNLSVSPGIASFGEVFQALAVARSVWRTISAWSLLPLSSLQPPTKAPASWTHSKRFARFGCGCAGCAALRCIADFQSAGLEMSRSRGSREVPQAGSPAIQQIGNRFEICATLTFSTRLRCARAWLVGGFFA